MANVSLVMFKSDGTRRDFPLVKDATIIGRKVNCDLRIPLTSVSRQHCEVRRDEDKLTVRDMGSSNGTYLNSVRVQEGHLSAGDELVVGPVVFTVVVDGHPADIKPVRTIVNSDDSIRQPSGQKASAHVQQGSSVGSVLDDDEDLELPEMLEEDDSSPTVDLDDPIAALEALSSENDDSDEFDDLDFFDDDDDDR